VLLFLFLISFAVMRSCFALSDINKLDGVKAAVASRMDRPDLAQICMDNLVAHDKKTLSQCFGGLVEISSHDQTYHLKQLQKKTGIPFENILFFDNEEWNTNAVAKLGVKCVHVPMGMRREDWDDAKKAFGL
jgi:magnesium-dependent phosphatase 1